MMQCPACGSHIDEFLELPFAFFRHLDFEIIKHNGLLSRCPRCGLVENRLDDAEIRRIGEMFQGDDYLHCPFMEHTLSVDGFDKPVTRTFLQASLIRDRLALRKPRILEIGCFHGDLLRELDGHCEAAELHGHDISEGFREWFPRGKRFHFWCGDLRDIDCRFDMIILSGSIMYIRDIEGLMAEIRRLLRPDGEVFIQAVDISKNPYAILLGDQFYHYTPAIMGNMFANFGMHFEHVESGWFPKEFIGFARADTTAASRPMRKDDTVMWCIETVREKSEQIVGVARDIDAFGVLGTTSAAAFVDSLVGSEVGFFVDENPNRVGLRFHGKPVLHPSELREGDAVVIPYGDSSERIKARLREKYKGRFICL